MQVMLKAAEGTSIADRARMAALALACVCLAQGVAFFHAGDEILRSKSLDRDSYNSGAPRMNIPQCGVVKPCEIAQCSCLTLN